MQCIKSAVLRVISCWRALVSRRCSTLSRGKHLQYQGQRSPDDDTGVGATLTAGCVRQQGIESTSTSYVGGNNAAMGGWVVVRQLTISIRCGQEELRGRRVRYTLALGRSSDSLASMRELFETWAKGNQSSTKRQIDGKQKKFTCSNEPCKKM